jgi:opacity protein-like surface antigen
MKRLFALSALAASCAITTVAGAQAPETKGQSATAQTSAAAPAADASPKQATAPTEAKAPAAATPAAAGAAPATPAAAEPAAPQPAAASAVPLADTGAQTAPAPQAPASGDGYENSSGEISDKQLTMNQPKVEDSPFVLALVYDTALPLGKTKDLTGKFSGRGFTVDGRYRSKAGITLGFAVSWQVFEEKSNMTFDYDNATISGTSARETSTTPMLATVGYISRANERILPYVRLGVGGMRVWRRVDIGISRIVDETWHFSLVPEIGAEIPVARFLLIPAIRYNVGFASGGAPSQSYINFSLGVGFD